jgi:hypothetical protein
MRADLNEHVEASFQGAGRKTWNHPVVVGDRLYLRNSQPPPLPLAETRDQIAIEATLSVE